MTETILVSDIGGTNARFALAQLSGPEINIRAPKKFCVDNFETALDAVQSYLKEVNASPRHACFAAAGPVVNGEVDFTNSHWRLRAKEIKSALGLEVVLFINDFYALAAGLKYMSDDAFSLIKPGVGDRAAPKLVIGPGTGFGQALIVPTGNKQKIIATEGGHVTFAPCSAEENQVVNFIAREHAHVSVERLLSGSGLVNIYRALSSISSAPQKLSTAEEITAAAKEGNDAIAVNTMNMFCDILGQVAGDAVLGAGARGGVVLAGGILPNIQDLLIASNFIDRFLDKGRMQTYVDTAPVHLLIKGGAALYGAATALEENLHVSPQ